MSNTFSNLDFPQVLKKSYDSNLEALKTVVVGESAVDLTDVAAPAYIDYTTINGSGGAVLQVIASVGTAIRKLQFLDTTGVFIGLYMGAPGSEIQIGLIGPGSDQALELAIPIGSRLSIRAMETAAPVAGKLGINFLV